jgi:hypothetical protein
VKRYNVPIVEKTVAHRPYEMQQGAIDCGYFVCAYMRCIAGLTIGAVQVDMRNCMKAELKIGKLTSHFVSSPQSPTTPDYPEYDRIPTPNFPQLDEDNLYIWF